MPEHERMVQGETRERVEQTKTETSRETTTPAKPDESATESGNAGEGGAKHDSDESQSESTHGR